MWLADPAKRDQGTARAVASEGGSTKPWQLTCGVEPVGAQTSRIEVWEPLPRFQRMYGNACMSRGMFAAGTGSSWKTSAKAVQRRNMKLETPHRVPARTSPSGAVRRGPPSSRPQNDRSTDSLCHVPGKVTDTQHHPMKAARRGTTPCKATGVERPKAIGAHLLHQHDLDDMSDINTCYTQSCQNGLTNTEAFVFILPSCHESLDILRRLI
ncbi:hypothetical protein AAY473_036144 [Plecturocebus cupreus]